MVSCGMPISIIYRLEIVDIEHCNIMVLPDQCVFPEMSRLAAVHHLQPAVKLTAIIQTGQRVFYGQDTQGLHQFHVVPVLMIIGSQDQDRDHIKPCSGDQQGHLYILIVLPQGHGLDKLRTVLGDIDHNNHIYQRQHEEEDAGLPPQHHRNKEKPDQEKQDHTAVNASGIKEGQGEHHKV